MRAPADLNPEDLAHRIDIANQLQAARETAGISARRLASMLGYRDHSAVRQMERRHTWQAETLQRWARALNQHVTFTLAGLTVPDDGDLLAATYTAILANPDLDPAYADKTVTRQAVNDLARIRRNRMTAAQLGRLIGLDETSVLWREANPDGASIASMQQTARGLDGALLVALTPTFSPSRVWSAAS